MTERKLISLHHATSRPDGPARNFRRVALLVLLALGAYGESNVRLAGAELVVLEQSVFGSGGGQSTGGIWVVTGTLGQPLVGRSSANSSEGAYRLDAGFWPPSVRSDVPAGPVLRMVRQGRSAIVSWPVEFRDYRLQTAPSLNAPGLSSWTDVEQTPELNGSEWQVRVELSEAVRFYRLQR